MIDAHLVGLPNSGIIRQSDCSCSSKSPPRILGGAALTLIVTFQYLRFARDFNTTFPGFETDIHGLVEEKVDAKMHYYMDCVKQG